MRYEIKKADKLPNERAELSRFPFAILEVKEYFTVIDVREVYTAKQYMYQLNKLKGKRFISRKNIEGYNFYRVE